MHVHAGPDAEEDDDETCGFCIFMKGGGCKSEFVVRAFGIVLAEGLLKGRGCSNMLLCTLSLLLSATGSESSLPFGVLSSCLARHG